MRIDSGRTHTCLIDPNGNVRCWGAGGAQLGYARGDNIGDNETPASAGVVDLGGHTATAISAGVSPFTCAILDNGLLKCWGYNNTGSLGYGNTMTIGDDETPAAVGTVDLGVGRTARAIAAGEGQACAILDNGTVRCWGGRNQFGQLGYGNTTMIGDDETPAAAGPVDLGVGRTAVAISAGSSYTCAILDNGSVRCWGYNGYGQLGTGNTSPVGDNETPGSLPPVDLGAGRTAVAIATALRQTCAILDNGAVKCWGEGAWGALGYGNENDVWVPSTVGTVDLGPGRTAKAIAVGDTQSCALLDNGTMRCWGSGSEGELGYGNTATIGDDETPGSVGPLDLGTNREAVAITAGRGFTCAELDNGSVRCWGDNSYGQLGYPNQFRIGDDEAPSAAGPVDLGSAHGAIETAAGGNHSCALFDTGTVRCWGLGSSGQLGNGGTDTIGDNESPGAGAAVDLGAHSAIEIAAGEDHTCALLDDGTMRCWGKGVSGQLGYGNTENAGDNESVNSLPSIELGGESALAMALGGNHSCALMTNGTVRCWGLNSSGQLGYGNTSNIGDDELPDAVAPVVLGRNATAISAGASHTCARLDDGSTRCWGSGLNGRLGYANTNTIGDNETPSSAGAPNLGRSVLELSAGASHTCARLDDETLRCWGSGSNGRLGYANTSTIGDNETPSSAGAVNVGRSIGAIAAGGSHTCARLDNGSVRCWGLASSGQLGYANTNTIGDNEVPALAGPVDLGGGRTAIDLAAGSNHNCALLDNGAIRCWGLNSSGQLGTGTTVNVGDNETPGSVSVVDFVDDPPVAVDDGKTLAEDSPATAIDVLANDTDIDGGSKTIASKTDPAHGSVAITGAGEGLSYAPDPNYCGPDSFTYTLNGGSTATVSVTVTCVDDPPVAVNDSQTLQEDASATAIDVLVNDTDIDGGSKEVVSKTEGANGAVAIKAGGSGVTYTPEANYCGTDSFGYELNGGSTATVSLSVTCVDDPPAAVNDSTNVQEDAAPTAIDVLANDTDIDGGSKTIASKTDPAHGSVAITGAGEGLSYAPDPNYCGPDSFTYTLNGGSTATVSITVACVDDPPVAVDDSKTLLEDAAATPIDVLANDTDIDAGPKSISSKTNGSHGSVSISGGGSGLSYLPDPNYCGPDSFSYTLNGGSTAAVSVTVTCVDDPPTAIDDTATVAEDSGPSAIGVLANDTDPDAGPKTITSKANGSHGAVSITGAGTGLTYAPDSNYCGSDSFTYTLNGGSTATVSITVTCLDDPPTALNDDDTVLQDSGPNAIDVLANDTDIDGGLKTVAGKTNGAHGSVSIIGVGAGITYQPAAGYCGTDSFTYTLNGGSTATVSIAVTCVENHEPPPAEEKPSSSSSEQSSSSQTIIEPSGSNAPIVNVTPGVGVVSGRRHPRIAIKGIYAFFTLTCRLKESDCAGIVTITATIPSPTLGPTMEKLGLIKGRFRIGAGRSVLVRAKLTPKGLEALEAKKTLRGIVAHMGIVDSINGEKGEILVNLVRRPRASLLPGAGRR